MREREYHRLTLGLGCTASEEALQADLAWTVAEQSVLAHAVAAGGSAVAEPDARASVAEASYPAVDTADGPSSAAAGLGAFAARAPAPAVLACAVVAVDRRREGAEVRHLLDAFEQRRRSDRE